MTDEERKARHAAYMRQYYLTHPEARAKKLEAGHRRYTENREARHEYRVAQYWADPEKARKQTAQWRLDNPDKAKEVNRNAYIKSDKERRRLRARAWEHDHKDEIAIKRREYYKKHPEKQEIRWIARRTRAKGIVSTLTVEQWKWIKSAYGNRCAYCGAKGKLSKDHVIPLVKGGGTVIQNIVPACKPCNSKKWIKEPKVPVKLALL